jgi:ribosomal protein L11 methyltransferase
MQYVAINFTDINPTQTEIAIALLADMGFEGFEENDNILQAFIPQADYNDEAVKQLSAQLNINFTQSIIAQQNWNADWEKSFAPVIVGNFAAIRAGFHSPVNGVQHEIIITPKMSFGTGHHATTYLMMAQMQQIDFNGKSVLDFGTGTGVLAIAAEKCGAIAIDAIDNDDWSIDNARENAVQNGAKNINIYKADAITAGKKYDVVLANINLNVITANMHALAACCNKAAIILLSGFLTADLTQIQASLSANKMAFVAAHEKQGWLCVESFGA